MEFNNDRILLIVAHPDDEVLGLGATMNYLKTNTKSTIRVVILSKGIKSRYEDLDQKKISKEIEIHMNCIKESKKIIGYDELSLYDLPDNKFDTIARLEVVRLIEKEIKIFKPDIIFTHHGGDLNIDHQIIFESVITATRPINENCKNLKCIFSFETPSSTEWQSSNDPRKFSPNFFFPFKIENLNSKIKAMNSYSIEKRIFPHPRSKKALKNIAMNNGLNVNKKYAEAFMLIKGIYRND